VYRSPRPPERPSSIKSSTASEDADPKALAISGCAQQLSALAELEEAGLIQVRRSDTQAIVSNGIREFADRLPKLPGAHRMTNESTGAWYFPPSRQAETLAPYVYSCTDFGRQTLDTIIEVVTEQLRAPVAGREKEQ
jgi:hypothetical protein